MLWWDTPLQEQAWRRFSAILRGHPLSDEEIALHVHGRTNRHTLETLLGRRLTAQEVSTFTQQKESLYRSLCLAQGEKFCLSPGAVPLLDFLVQHGIPHTIATASEKTNLDFFVEHLRLEQWFKLDQIVYDDGLLPGKPEPDIYLRAAVTLHLEPAECVVVEDSISGLEAAQAAGIGLVIALAPPERHAALIEAGKANLALASLAQFPAEEIFLPPK